MSQSIYKTANIFLRKDLKHNVNFKTVSAYLQSIGFAIILYNCNKDNELLIKYNLLEFSKTVKGFTVFRKDFKAVFIDSDTPSEEKLCVLLHETAHIILGHIDKKDIKDERILEMEADTFAYHVLHPPKNTIFLKTIVSIMTVFCIALSTYCINSFKDNTTEETTAQTFNTAYTDVSSSDTQDKSETVYVTPSGSKYHRSDCRYVKNKNCTTYTIAEATLKYAPCSVCEP